ncbi:translation initiation factor 2 [Actinoplanes sp. NPDC051633]|uniref:translation initiation factor 2 n=1 Tax=Actinoplanes sp. NPDC051633 TaxID=3155670 RepID=UPI00341B19DA
MIDQHFLSPSFAPDVFGSLQGGERVLWQGRCGVAEYAFDQAASMPRWTLPETTVVLVTDRRLRYSHEVEGTPQVRSGELRWLWPQHLRVQPGARSDDRRAAATQIQLVCGGDDGTYPALVLAGGDLARVGDADRMANIMRQAIARFRVDNADKLGLTSVQMRMLGRILMGPEFRNHQGGEGQTASLLGALLVARPVAVPEPIAERIAEPAPTSQPPMGQTPMGQTPVIPEQVGQTTRLINYRPGRAADAARQLLAVRAEQEAVRVEPEVASRAADLAARIADLVSQEGGPAPRHSHQGHAEPRLDDVDIDLDLDSDVDSDIDSEVTTNLADRAERIRRTAARMAANSARWKVGIRREIGLSTRGGQNN